MFKDLSIAQAELIYLGLKSLIETKSGHGLHNGTGQHIVYDVGAKGEKGEFTNADSPESSTLFKMLSALSIKLKNDGIEASHYGWWKDLGTWKQYCQFIVDAYKDKTDNSDENSLK